MQQNDAAQSFVASRVRQNTLGAGIAAGLMLYFAYSRGFIMPEGDGAFETGGRIFIRTLQIGSFAMVLAAVLSAVGLRFALLFDGVCSTLIGTLFCVAALLMQVGGGSGLLYGIFGLMFLFVGIRNVIDWKNLPTPAGRPISEGASPSHDSTPLNPRRVAGGEVQEHANPEASRPSVESQTSATSQFDAPATDDPSPPPEGYLSQFSPDEKKHENE